MPSLLSTTYNKRLVTLPVGWVVDPHLEILDAPGEGYELPAELQQVETVVVGVAGPDSGPQCIAGPASVVLPRERQVV